jgi:hypothetical protein
VSPKLGRHPFRDDLRSFCPTWLAVAGTGAAPRRSSVESTSEPFSTCLRISASLAWCISTARSRGDFTVTPAVQRMTDRARSHRACGDGLASQDAFPPRSGGGRGAPNRVNQFGWLGPLLARVRPLGLPIAIVVSLVVFESCVLIAHDKGSIAAGADR